jgi:hypothetical protein
VNFTRIACRSSGVGCRLSSGVGCRLSAGAEPNRDGGGAQKQNEELRNLISNREFANREWRSREEAHAKSGK